MKFFEALFKISSVIISLIPGFAILKEGLFYPPIQMLDSNESRIIAVVIIDVFSIFTILFLLLNKTYFLKLKRGLFNKLVIFSLFLFIITLAMYLFFWKEQIKINSPYQDIVVPLCYKDLKGQKLQDIADWQSYRKEKGGTEGVKKMINGEAFYSLLLTEIMLMINYILIFLTLAFTFMVLGIKLKRYQLKL